MGDYNIQLTSSINFPIGYETDAYMMEIQVILRETSDDDDDDSPGNVVGFLEGYRMMMDIAVRENQDVFDQWDGHVQETHDIYAATHDKRGNYKNLTALPENMSDNEDVLIGEIVVIDPKHRGKNLGLAMMKRFIEVFGTGCRLVVIQPSPVSEETATTRVDNQDFSFDIPKLNDVGVKKLSAYWSKLGFKRIGKTQFYALDNSQFYGY